MIVAPMAHDAEWMLQRELLVNELMLEKGRRRKPRGRDTTRIAASFTLIPTTPGEDAAAERAMRRAAARTGAAADDLAQVLEALGLIEPAQAPTKPVRVRARTLCEDCGRMIEVSAEGRLASHSRSAHQPSTVWTCDGSRRRIKAVAA